MPRKYNMYIGIKEEDIQKFETLWHTHINQLKPLPTKLHALENNKAAVFNNWIRITQGGHMPIVKSNRLFMHSVIHNLVIKLRHHIPPEVLEVVLQHKNNDDFTFVYSYYLLKIVQEKVEIFLEENIKMEENHLGDFYFLTDDELSAEAPIYKLLKDILYGFVNQQLNTSTIERIYFNAMQETVCYMKRLEEKIK